jgi:hypothetical protein
MEVRMIEVDASSVPCRWCGVVGCDGDCGVEDCAGIWEDDDNG